MRSFVIPGRAGLVTSLYDSLNHLLTLRDIRSFFRSAFRALRSGGLLIFDVNNEACYRRLWKGTTTMEHADFTLILNNSYAPSRSIARSGSGRSRKKAKSTGASAATPRAAAF